MATPQTKLQTIRHEGQDLWLIRPTDETLRMLKLMHDPTASPERLGLIVGVPGIGKTTAGKIYAARHKDVLYIDLPPRLAMQSNGAPCAVIERALGIARRSRIIGERLDEVVEELRQRPRMILLDTAHRLQYDQIDAYRFIMEKARVPIVFLSVPALEPLFDVHPDLGTRLQIRYRLHAATREEIRIVLGDFSEAVADDIHERTGGRIREVLRLKRHAEMSRKAASHWTTDDTAKIAALFAA